MVRQAAIWMLAAAGALAQENAPPGLLRGDLISSQGAGGQGQFKFLVWPDHVYTCAYDERTNIERDTQPTTMERLGKGEHLEVVADRQPGSSLCYARTVQIRPQMTPSARLRLADALAAPSWASSFTLSGAVSSISPEILVLRLRSGEHKLIRLRAETNYFHDGQSADRTALSANTVVFVRAKKDMRGEAQATQVIWGDILQPQP